jgi:signal transduction histidine kinase
MDFKQHTILYVDDEDANRVVMKHNLGRDFTILMASSAEEALEILSRETVAVLLTDHRMPRMTGVDLAEVVLKRFPEVVRVIITAYSDLETTVDAINRAHVNRFIKKPWTREELVAVMHESLLSYHNARRVRALEQRMIELDRITTLGILAGAVAHDLRQPLSYIVPNLDVIVGDLDWLSHQALPPPVMRRLQTIRGAVDDLTTGVTYLKSISTSLLKSIHTHKGEQASLDLGLTVQNALTLTRNSLVHAAILTVSLPEEPVLVMGAEGRVIQVVVNLLLNAIQALGPGPAYRNSVEVTLKATGEAALFRVKDSGCGIAPEHLEKLFVPFFTTKGSAGNGLGLVICKQIAEEMGGKITVESTVGVGTCFTVELPRLPPTPDPAP